MLRLRAGTATLLIGPRAAAGEHGGRYCLDSETDIRQRLTLALQDPASRDAIRRFWAHWQSDLRLAGVKDQSIVDRIARLGVRGPLIVLLVVDTSVHRRDSSASRSKQVAEAQQNQKQFKPWSGPVEPPTLVTVSSIAPAAAKVPVPVDRSIITPPKKAIGDWTIAEKLGSIVVRAADSKKLSYDTQQQLKGMLSDPKFVAWLIGSLLVWFVSQFFVVGEILDMLLVGAAMILTGTGIFFALQSLVGAAHLIGEFVEATRNAKDEKDLDTAADILANIIVMIGITVLIAALTHATTRATSAGEKVSTVKKPPPERPVKVERLQERPAQPQQVKQLTAPSRRDYLNKKFGRTGDLNRDINLRGYLNQAEHLDVSSEPGKAIFYSGPGNRARAEAFARGGGTTLESTPGGKWFDNQVLFKRMLPEDAQRIWDKLSERYAQQASGTATVFADGASPRGTFSRVELPILQSNPNVTGILRNGNELIRLK